MGKVGVGIGMAGGALAGWYVGVNVSEMMSAEQVRRADDNYLEAQTDYLYAERLLPDESGSSVIVGESEVPINDYKRILEPYETAAESDEIIIEEGRVKIVKTLEAVKIEETPEVSTEQEAETERLIGRDAIMAILEEKYYEAEDNQKRSMKNKESNMIRDALIGGLGGVVIGGGLGCAAPAVTGRFRDKKQKKSTDWDDGRGNKRPI